MARQCVLIVDDEPGLRSAVREILQSAGYEPMEAADGTGGLAKAASLRPALILLDVRMPDLDGYEVCRQLKANPLTAPIPVVFLTAVEDSALNHRAFEAGAAACLTKPFRAEALLAVVEASVASAGHQRMRKVKARGNGG